MCKRKNKNQNVNNSNKIKKINNFHYIPMNEKKQATTKKIPLKIIKQELKKQKLYLNFKIFHKIRKSKNFIGSYITDINLVNKVILFINLLLIFNLLILLNIQMVISEKNINKIYLNYSSITLKIKGPGTQNIFSSQFSEPYPDIIYINEERIENIKNNYYLNETENIVKLVWSNSINNCNKLFDGCKNITYIDLSNFDFSEGISANCMFGGCITLEKIIFPSSQTVKVTDLGGIFTGCESLTSLDLSKFDTSLASDFGHTFKNCKSLTSLNLSNFLRGSIRKKLYGMFQYCENLIYLNLESCSFDYISNKDYFLEGTRNMIICSNHDVIKNIARDNNCINIDCSENWQSKIKRFNTENNECITTDCQRINYKYEYLYKCYDKCPDGTYNNNYKCEKCHPDCKLCDKPADINNSNCKSCSSSSKFLKFGNCVDNCINGYYTEKNDMSNKICKCDLEKCFKCTEESLNNNLCVSCNEGYYPKYEEIQNDNSYHKV